MLNLLRSFLFYGFVFTAVLSVVAVAVYCLLPTPKSPPLTNSFGVVLDTETEAKLVEIVFDAARNDDFITIDEYLKEGFSPNVRSPRGDSLLIVAAYNDSASVVQRLLQHQEIDIEARNRMGLTAVAAAAFKGFEKPLQLLIDSGASVDASNSTNQTALMFASLAGRENTVQMLLKAGANRNQVDQLGNTAYSVARTQGANNVLRLLNPEQSAD
jgi:ankyrin repeat protein